MTDRVTEGLYNQCISDRASAQGDLTVESRAIEKGTFVIDIRYRRNATWQGVVMWADKKESVPFRSALELIKLIDSVTSAEELAE